MAHLFSVFSDYDILTENSEQESFKYWEIMSDADLHYESDEYHEDSYHDLHRDDSLPDLVLSSSTVHTEHDPDLLLEPPADLEAEYFSGGCDQVLTSVSSKNGTIRVSYTDTEKPYMTQRITSCADKYRSYLNLTVPSDEESGDEGVSEEFKRYATKKNYVLLK